MGNLKRLQTGQWCGVVSGRAVAIAEVAGVFLVYIDHILQEGRRFRTAEAAYQWLCTKIGMVRDYFAASGSVDSKARMAFDPAFARSGRRAFR